ncbi:hypothetical protein ACFL1H_03375 [Nanoarchaeota archaeon]
MNIGTKTINDRIHYRFELKFEDGRAQHESHRNLGFGEEVTIHLPTLENYVKVAYKCETKSLKKKAGLNVIDHVLAGRDAKVKINENIKMIKDKHMVSDGLEGGLGLYSKVLYIPGQNQSHAVTRMAKFCQEFNDYFLFSYGINVNLKVSPIQVYR